MKKSLLFTVLIFVLALFQATTLSSLPTSLAIINPVLIIIIGLTLSFRFRLAFFLAIVAGLVGDSLISRQIGTYTFALLFTVIIVSFLVTRFVSHRTAVSSVGTNAVSFLLFYTMTFIIEAIARAISGGPFLHPASVLAAGYVALALPIQCGVVLMMRWLVTKTGSKLRKLVLITSEFDRL